MKRILISVMTIALVSATAFGATRAFFTDTETSANNTFSTGTIDIAVDGQNPWSRTEPYQLEDMKPSQTDYVEFRVNNVGTNPVNLYKKLTVTGTTNEPVSESECEAEEGEWIDDVCTGNTPKSDIDTIIDYDLSVKLYNPQNELVWWQMLYNKDATIANIEGTDLFLGMIPEGWHMDVVQSYHMQDNENENWAQGDSMTFDITLTAEQLNGSLTLENKNPDPIAGGEEEWLVLSGDGISGTLDYLVKDKIFDYDFNATGLAANTNYSLIHYVDPWPGNGTGAVGLLGSGTTNGSGVLALSGNSDLNSNMINAKIWLVLSSDYDAGTKSMTAWNPASYLFETGLIDYYDADL